MHIHTPEVGLMDLDFPRPQDIHINGIAQGLAMIVRYNGNYSRADNDDTYTVAEHCCLMMQHVSDELKPYALMHDAHEKYIGDIVGPIKHLFPEYYKLADKLDAVIAEKFNLRWTTDIRRAIMHADKAMLAMERVKVCEAQEPWPSVEGVNPMPAEPLFLSHGDAKAAFLTAATFWLPRSVI